MSPESAEMVGRWTKRAKGWVSDAEFDEGALAVAASVLSEPPAVRMAAAARGSANPAALAWMAESLQLDAATRVVDLGAGLGGPAAWIQARYHSRVIGLEPASGAVTGACQLFDGDDFGPLTMVQGSVLACPLRSDSFDVALLLGVLSVLVKPEVALAEALRVAPRIGVWEFCSTTGRSLQAGGSTFPTVGELRAQLATAGWMVRDVLAQLPDPPAVWKAAGSNDVVGVPDAAVASEREVSGAIEGGLLEPTVLVADRRPPW